MYAALVSTGCRLQLRERCLLSGSAFPTAESHGRNSCSVVATCIATANVATTANIAPVITAIATANIAAQPAWLLPARAPASPAWVCDVDVGEATP